MEAQGFVSPGFEAVRVEFERNFSERREVGAAFAATAHGELAPICIPSLLPPNAGP